VADIIYCTNCGTKNEGDASFCISCGSKLLQIVGITIDLAKNGQEAGDMLGKGKYDLVFMDVRMPVMNGLEATEAIRSSQVPWKDIPIVALTADASAEDAQRCLAVGMNSHLRKPLKVEELIQAVDQLNLAPGTVPVTAPATTPV